MKKARWLDLPIKCGKCLCQTEFVIPYGNIGMRFISLLAWFWCWSLQIPRKMYKQLNIPISHISERCGNRQHLRYIYIHELYQLKGPSQSAFSITNEIAKPICIQSFLNDADQTCRSKVQSALVVWYDCPDKSRKANPVWTKQGSTSRLALQWNDFEDILILDIRIKTLLLWTN